MSGRSASALVVGRDRRRVVETVGLVVDTDGDLPELVAVLAGVVGAEEELAAAGQLDAKVGLGSAAVTTVGRGQCARGNCSGHESLPFCGCLASNGPRRRYVPRSASHLTQQSKHA